MQICLNRKGKGEMVNYRIDMKPIQEIYERCLNTMEIHEKLTGCSLHTEEALALFRYALDFHFMTPGYGYETAIQFAYGKIFKSTIETKPVKL